MHISEKVKFEDRGSERAVISSILQYPDLIIEADTKIGESDFLSEHHQALYSLIKLLYGRGVKTFDLVALLDCAEQNGVIDLIGGTDYIQALMQTPFDKENFGVYVEKLLDCSTRFKLYMQAQYIQKDLLEAPEDIESEQLIAKAEARILDVSLQCQQVEDAVNLSSGLRKRVQELADNPVEISGLPTGVPLLDKALNGLLPGSLTVIAARAKSGKSTMLMNLGCYLAFDLGLPILYVDTEMHTREVQTRALSHLSRVPERAIVNGKFIENEDYCVRVSAACKRIEEGLFFHRYYPGYTIDGLKSLARKYYAREGIGALIFDYIKAPETNSVQFKEHQILGNVTTALKDLAGKLDIPVIAAAQIKRSDTVVDKTHYSDTDIADSDRIGRFCNNLLTIARKSKKEVEEDGEDCGTHRIQVLLARAGGTLYRGIDIHCHFPTLTMTQAINQSNGIPNFDGGSLQGSW